MSVSSRISTADAAFSAVKNFYFASRQASGGWSWAYPTLRSVTSMRCRLKALSPPFASELAEGVDFVLNPVPASIHRRDSSSYRLRVSGCRRSSSPPDESAKVFPDRPTSNLASRRS